LLLIDFCIYTDYVMPTKEETKERKRMVVEEVKAEETPKADETEKVIVEPVEPKILEEAAKDVVSPESESVANETCKEVRPLDSREENPIEPKKSPSIVLWIIIPGIFLLGAILGGIVFYQKGVNSGATETSTPVTESTSTPVVSASPSATIDLTKYSVTIFNGSGIAGEAGRAKTLLTDEGFKVGTTANAATYDYTKTIIKAKSTVEEAFVTALSEALGKMYVVDTAQTLSTSSADAVQVIIGSSKAE
jgi:hypothetical protein